MFFDRVRGTSTTTGTGTLIISGTPVQGFRLFSEVPSGTWVDYAIQEQSGAEHEVGRGKVVGLSLTRELVLESSNGDNLVNFGAGTKDVFLTLAARSIQTSGKALSRNLSVR